MCLCVYIYIYIYIYTIHPKIRNLYNYYNKDKGYIYMVTSL